jgi:hypothetical protein
MADFGAPPAAEDAAFSRSTASRTSPSVTAPPSKTTTLRAPDSTSEGDGAEAHPTTRKEIRTTKPQKKAVLAEKNLPKPIQNPYFVLLV